MTSGGYTKTEAWNLQLQHKIERAETRAEQAEADRQKYYNEASEGWSKFRQAEAKLAEVTAENTAYMVALSDIAIYAEARSKPWHVATDALSYTNKDRARKIAELVEAAQKETKAEEYLAGDHPPDPLHHITLKNARKTRRAAADALREDG